jgi:hypothetical protein
MKRIEKRDSQGQIDLGSNRQGSAGADAARALYALNPIEAVNGDDLIGEAVAKSTFMSTSTASLSSRPRSPTNSRTNLTDCCSLAGWRPRTRSSELLRAAGRSSATRSAILPGARSWPARGPIHAEHRA